MTDSYVTALLRERAACVAAKKAARVRAIDDVLLSRFGIAVEVEAAVEPPPETAEPRGPRGRQRRNEPTPT